MGRGGVSECRAMSVLYIIAARLTAEGMLSSYGAGP